MYLLAYSEEERTVVFDVMKQVQLVNIESKNEREIPTDEINLEELDTFNSFRTLPIYFSDFLFNGDIKQSHSNSVSHDCITIRSSSTFRRDEEANASFLLGKRDVLLNNYQSACDHLSKTCERM